MESNCRSYSFVPCNCSKYSFCAVAGSGRKLCRFASFDLHTNEGNTMKVKRKNGVRCWKVQAGTANPWQYSFTTSPVWLLFIGGFVIIVACSSSFSYGGKQLLCRFVLIDWWCGCFKGRNRKYRTQNFTFFFYFLQEFVFVCSIYLSLGSNLSLQ